MYDCDRSVTYDWVKAYLPLLERALGKKCALPKRKINSVQEFLRVFPTTKEIFIDGTERRVQRPKNNDSQKDHYSGKKGTHTKKNLVVVNSKKKVLALTETKPGKNHDFKLFEDFQESPGHLFLQ